MRPIEVHRVPAAELLGLDGLYEVTAAGPRILVRADLAPAARRAVVAELLAEVMPTANDAEPCPASRVHARQ
jgi:hypothetical protein